MNFDLSHIAQVAAELDAMCDSDEILFHDMLVGETDIDHIVARIHEQIARDDEILVGIDERQKSLAERKARIARRKDAAKGLIGKVLRTARLKKLELPEVTYSVRDGRPSLVIDPAAVPDEYQRIKTEPDKKKINDAFMEASILPNWIKREGPKDIVTARTK